MLRRIALALCVTVLALSACVLAGCGKKEPAGTPKTVDDSNAKAKAALSSGPSVKKSG